MCFQDVSFATEEGGLSDPARHGRMTGPGVAEAGQESARIDLELSCDANQDDQWRFSEQIITNVQDNIAKERELEKKGKGEYDEEKGGHLSYEKRSLDAGRQAGPSVGNRSVGGVHHQHFLKNHLNAGPSDVPMRRSQDRFTDPLPSELTSIKSEGIPDVVC